jgi:hypothetical protein
MILARITQAVRTQNWFAVALEFVIVIAGVVIGFQITEWRAQAQRADAEHLALQRLQSESEAVVTFWAETVSQSVEANRNRQRAVALLSEGHLPPEDIEAFEAGLSSMGFYAAMTPPSTVFDELVASGGLTQISDIAARAAVSNYASGFDFISGQLDQFRLSVGDLMTADDGLVFSVYTPDSPFLRRIEYDFEVLASNRVFVSKMVGAVRNQRVFLYFRMGALRDAIEMCVAVSAAVDRECGSQADGQAAWDAARAFTQ